MIFIIEKHRIKKWSSRTSFIDLLPFVANPESTQRIGQREHFSLIKSKTAPRKKGNKIQWILFHHLLSFDWLSFVLKRFFVTMIRMGDLSCHNSATWWLQGNRGKRFWKVKKSLSCKSSVKMKKNCFSCFFLEICVEEWQDVWQSVGLQT